MELLRVPPYGSKNVSIEVPAGYTNKDFTAHIQDMADLSTSSQELTGSTGDSLSITLPARYDTDYSIELRDSNNNIIATETYELRRPYSVSDAELASEKAEYAQYEEISRAVIDSIVKQGFYYTRHTIEHSGLGGDFLPLWVDAKKILKVYENNVLVYDVNDIENATRKYEITKDKSAIVEVYDGTINRMQSHPNWLPASNSDLLDMNYSYRGFPKGFDYRIVLEVGYTTVPADIKKASAMLTDDIACGRLEYYKRYINDYNTDQFKLKFDSRSFEGTGNILVDKILTKYAKTIIKPGVF